MQEGVAPEGRTYGRSASHPEIAQQQSTPAADARTVNFREKLSHLKDALSNIKSNLTSFKSNANEGRHSANHPSSKQFHLR